MKPSVTLLPAIIAAVCAGAACAQTAKTPEIFAVGPHTGPVEQAIVGVTTIFRDRHSQLLEERHGCGMVLRCDGFVLFSAALLDHRGDEPDDLRPSIEVTLHPGTPEERKVTAPWPKAIPSGLSLRLVKLAEIHTPALRTLLSAGLKPGDDLTVVFLPWNEAAHSFGPIQRRPVHFGAPVRTPRPPWAESVDSPLESVPSGAIVVGPEGMAVGMVTSRDGEDRRGFVSMEALAKVTNCVAAVPTTDAEFAAANRAGSPADRNDPADPAALPAAGQDAARPEDGANADDQADARSGAMVKVRGGPVLLPRAICDTQLEMDKAKVACIPPFQIDRYEVTNQEYWDFWSRLPNKTSAQQAFRRDTWPAGWAASPVPFSAELARVPVLGVPLAGAQAYARSRGKRLPTPYEWALAALGPNGDAKAPDWLAQYITETNNAALRIKQAHLAFLKQAPEIHGEDFLLQSTRLHTITLTKVKFGRSWITVNADQRIHGTDFMIGLPWVISPLLGFAPELQSGVGFFDALNGVEGLDLPLRLKMQNWSKALIEAETQPLWDKWKAPMYVLAVGSRSFDRSPCGASDMLWNGAELVLPPATAPGGLNGFALSVTMLHPQEKPVLDEMLLVSGPNTAGLAENHPSSVAYPLSRLIGRSPGFPVAQWLWFQNDLEETRASMRLISGWQVNMHPAISIVDIPTDNHSPFVGPVFYDNFPLYREWAKPPRHSRAEIGSAIAIPAQEPLPTPMVPRETGATMRFLIPIGFRCAR